MNYYELWQHRAGDEHYAVIRKRDATIAAIAGPLGENQIARWRCSPALIEYTYAPAGQSWIDIDDFDYQLNETYDPMNGQVT